MVEDPQKNVTAERLRDFYGHEPRVFMRTFGCQQNVRDSEEISGMLCALGCAIADSPEAADIVIFNTCAVREHAEDRVFGNVGRLKILKERNKKLIIAVGGCMVQQPHIAKKLRESYPYVDVIFNTNEMYKLPSLLVRAIERGGGVVEIVCSEFAVREGLPVKRDGGFRAYVPIMYGCDNFCTYCVVPLVRGRERSREPEYIKAEAERAIAEGYRDIMLLGQNVNSYGKGLQSGESFSSLLRELAKLSGDFTLRFMTSHPKDATHELFDTMAEFPKLAPHIHLPVQSGSDEILRRMNRRYTSGDYLELIDYARRAVPQITFSSDIIVGFPGETREDFDATLALVREVRFASLFTFIYSKREGTPAAAMPDNTSHAVKAERLSELIEVQDEISERREEALVGTSRRVLVVGDIAADAREGRLADNSAVTIDGECPIGQFCNIEIVSRTKKRLYGKVL
ncbi:MAG: tRNA (N6-isopentenyl adenosine(37)-C2)-methylthiotransferase MiaB [Oscillospiraceae bacterium]